MRDDPGFSLFELLIALFLAMVLSIGFLSLTRGYQQADRLVHGMLERDENLRLVPLLLSRFLWPAGNNRWRVDRSGVKSTAGLLQVKSDFDGPGGLPDLSLNSPYEDIQLRCRGTDLQLQSGSGNYQPLLRNIHSFDPSFLRADLLVVEVAGRGAPAAHSVEERIEVQFFLWNYRKNLFCEEAP